MRTEGSEFPRSREFAPRCVMARVESPDEKAFFVGNSMRAGEGSDARPPTTGLARSRQRVSKALLGAAKPWSLCPCCPFGGRWGRGLRDAAARAAVPLVERLISRCDWSSGSWSLARLVLGWHFVTASRASCTPKRAIRRPSYRPGDKRQINN